MTPADYGVVANQGVAAAMFIMFITGLLRGWWCLGRELEQMRSDRDYWRNAAQRGLDMTETAIAPRNVRQASDARH